MPEIIVIAHNIRSTHNVGAFFRTCDGFGVTKLLLTGYTPYPAIQKDTRLPHFADKMTRQIHKTALGAETYVPFERMEAIPFDDLKKSGYTIIGLEQRERSVMLPDYTPPGKIALILGEEVDGISEDIIARCDDLIEIPMSGKKESFNVSVATGIALYALVTN